MWREWREMEMRKKTEGSAWWKREMCIRRGKNSIIKLVWIHHVMGGSEGRGPTQYLLVHLINQLELLAD
jgi:hypothetical protein